MPQTVTSAPVIDGNAPPGGGRRHFASDVGRFGRAVVGSTEPQRSPDFPAFVARAWQRPAWVGYRLRYLGAAGPGRRALTARRWRRARG